MIRYRPSVMFVKCNRLDHLYDREHDHYASMGHYWWFWLPVFRWNGGSPLRGSMCCDYNIKWLCFSVTLLLWKVR